MLSQVEKDGLRYSSNMDRWYDLLKQRFKGSVTEALLDLLRMKYTLQDARDRRDVGSNVYKVMRKA